MCLPALRTLPTVAEKNCTNHFASLMDCRHEVAVSLLEPLQMYAVTALRWLRPCNHDSFSGSYELQAERKQESAATGFFRAAHSDSDCEKWRVQKQRHIFLETLEKRHSEMDSETELGERVQKLALIPLDPSRPLISSDPSTIMMHSRAPVDKPSDRSHGGGRAS